MFIVLCSSLSYACICDLSPCPPPIHTHMIQLVESWGAGVGFKYVNREPPDLVAVLFCKRMAQKLGH